MAGGEGVSEHKLASTSFCFHLCNVEVHFSHYKFSNCPVSMSSYRRLHLTYICIRKKYLARVAAKPFKEFFLNLLLKKTYNSKSTHVFYNPIQDLHEILYNQFILNRISNMNEWIFVEPIISNCLFGNNW